jgi:O-antigen ligase
MYAIAAGCVLIAVMSLRSGGVALTGGIVIGRSDYLSNPNDFAQLLLIGLPFVWLMVLDTRGLWVRRVLASVTLIVILFVAAHTGSRSMLVGLAAMFVVALWKMPPERRLVIGLAGLVISVGVFQSLPIGLKQRYESVLLSNSVDSADPIVQSAATSREQRLSLLRESLSFTMRNPLFGVGPGMFDAAAAGEARRLGVRPQWLVTHNTYTEVSSEAGLPALLFFVGTLVTCFRTVSSIHRRSEVEDAEGARAVAYCLLLSLVAFAVTALFSNVSYKALLPALAGLSTALSGAVRPSPVQEADLNVAAAALT